MQQVYVVCVCVYVLNISASNGFGDVCDCGIWFNNLSHKLNDIDLGSLC